MTERPTRARRPRRLLAKAPFVAAVLVLLVGSVLPGAPPPTADPVRAAAVAPSAPSADFERPPASVTEVPKPAPPPPPPPTQAAGPAESPRALAVSSPWSVSDVLLAAYRRAVAGSPPTCHLPVSLLAAIGQVESGSLAGRSLDAANRALPPVLGPVLDGVSTAAIRDTDGGRLDGDSRWDRAVGPMQFIPGTWSAFGVDADGDGRADPQNVFDAAASAAAYLCARGRDLAVGLDLRSAILAYNHSTAYLATVLAWQQRFTTSGVVPLQTPTGTLRATGTRVVSAAGGSTTVRPSPIGDVTALPVAPAAPAGPSEPTATAGPSEPAASAGPSEPTASAGPSDPTATAGPSEPTTTAAPSEPTTTAAPSEPDVSAAPTAPPASAASAARLAFTTAPSPTGISGTALAAQPVVTIQDAAGNTVHTDTSSVTLTLTSPAGATLTCAANRTTAISGIAAFTGCAIDKAGTYTLTATHGALTATSSSVRISAGSAARLAFTTAPSPTAIRGTALETQPVVTIQDAAGNTVLTDTSSVTLTLTNPAGGILTCASNPIAVTSGIATFTGCAIDKPGTYTLTATNGLLTSVTSTKLTVRGASPARPPS